MQVVLMGLSYHGAVITSDDILTFKYFDAMFTKYYQQFFTSGLFL